MNGICASGHETQNQPNATSPIKARKHSAGVLRWFAWPSRSQEVRYRVALLACTALVTPLALVAMHRPALAQFTGQNGGNGGNGVGQTVNPPSGGGAGGAGLSGNGQVTGTGGVAGRTNTGGSSVGDGALDQSFKANLGVRF